MFVKKATAAELDARKKEFADAFGDYEEVTDLPVKEYMIKWLSAFAPDMTFSDAKSFCLPRLMYRNYIWHAFSFQKTDCFIDEDAEASFKNGFEGPAYVLFNTENLLLKVENGSVFNPENVKNFKNLIIFKTDFSETYVNTGNDEFGPFYKSADMAVADDSEPEEAEVTEEETEEAE